MNTPLSYEQRQLRARVVFGWLFIIYVYFFSQHSLISQLQQPVLIYPGSDNSFWLMHLLNIPQFFLNHHGAALALDITVTGSCLVSFILPEKVWMNRITILGTWLFYFVYSSGAGKHYAQIGYLITPVAFWVADPRKFSLLWDAMRYWVVFLYTCAGLYKVYYGGFFYVDDMGHILQQMNAEWLVFHPDGFQSSVIRYLIDHPAGSQWLFRLVVIIDSAVLIGFFTRRFDQWLLIGLISFHIGNYFLMHISFVEQSLIFAALLPWHKIERYFLTTTHHD